MFEEKFEGIRNCPFCGSEMIEFVNNSMEYKCQCKHGHVVILRKTLEET